MKHSAIWLFVFLSLILPPTPAVAQKLRTPADPFGLKWMGMPKKLEKYSIVATPEVPNHLRVCAPGVLSLKAEKPVQNGHPAFCSPHI
jgi:hypothetical protein